MLLLKSKSYKALSAQNIDPALKYIDAYWPKLTRYHPKDDHTLVGLPHKYLVPGYNETAPFGFNEQYYWDTYFIIQGLLDQEHKELVAGMLDNLCAMLERFHVIPNASRTYFTGRSQPPFLTSFIFDVYDLGGFSNKWLAKRIELAKQEYEHVWMFDQHPNWRRVYKGLSRYYDINMLHNLAEAESGWDMTNRFGRKCLDFLPVDLNALLYKYEMDFAKAAEILGNDAEALKWHKVAKKRRENMYELMWDKLRGFYYDYNYKKQRLGRVSSVAGYYTMWAGLATPQQAQRMAKQLKRFEHSGGLSTTENSIMSSWPSSIPIQWAYPNGWAPLQFMVVEGLKKYGYESDARRIAQKWLATNLDWFNKHHEFIEKYNVVHPKKEPVEGVYPNQTGFGWTNAIFVRFAKDWL